MRCNSLHALNNTCWRAVPHTALLGIWHLRHNNRPYQLVVSTKLLNRSSGMSSKSSNSQQPIVLHEYSSIVQGTLHKRYKRFLADVEFAHDSGAAGTAAAAAAAAAGAAVAAAVADKSSAFTAAAAGAGFSSSISKRRRGSSTGAVCTEVTATVTASAAATIQPGSAALTVVHCPNTGSMAGLLDSLPVPAACSVSSVATRKYKHTLEGICLHGPAGPVWVGVHSALANKLAAVLLKQQLLPELGQYTAVQPEVKLGGSSSTRFDFMLHRQDGRKVYVEVKSVTMAMTYADWSSSSSSSSSSKSGPKKAKSRKRSAGGSSHVAELPVEQTREAAAAVVAPAAPASSVAPPPATGALVAVFPDAVSERAQRHVHDLLQLKMDGNDAACLFVIQRNDCSCFAPATHIDPVYAAAVKAASAAGVQMLAVLCEFDPERNSIWLKGSVPVIV